MPIPKQRRGDRAGAKRGHYFCKDPAQMMLALEGGSMSQDNQDTRKRGAGGLTTNMGSLKMGGGSLQLVQYHGRLQSNHSRTWRNEQAMPAMPMRAPSKPLKRFAVA